jgi:heme exporter protein D
MARAQQPQRVGFRERLRQIGMVFSFTAKNDKLFVPLVIAAALVPVAFSVFATLAWGFLWIPVGLLLTALAVLIVLNLRANKAMLAQAANQPGASASIVENMRGDWRVTPAIASTTQMDMVHLVICRAGVILLGEGNPSRVKGLIGQERRRLSKVIGSADLRDFMVGSGEGEIPIAKLRVTLMKLPRTLSGKDVNALDKRLTALSARPQLPKGAIPKNMRPPKGAFRAMRGGPR